MENINFKYDLDKAILSSLKSKKIILHIGQHKTGSTALQRLMVRDKNNFDKYIYPETGLKFSAHNTMYQILSGRDTKSINEFYNSFFNEVAKSKAPLVVISNEFFSSSNEIMFNKKIMFNLWSNLSKVLEPFGEKEIVFYVREQADTIESRINQAIKSRICLKEINLINILENPSLDYFAFSELLNEYFPSTVISPRIFDTTYFENGDICTDFTRSFLGMTISCKQSNLRIQFIDQVLLFLRINNLDIDIDEKMELKTKMKSYRGQESSGQILTKNEIIFIRNKYNASNKAFFNKYKNIKNFKYNFDSNEEYSINERMLIVDHAFKDIK